ncbi:type IV secretion system protein [Candidatus Nanosynbacter sp. HMT-352]|uniref:type IV secretion system protein n=1 Tax=Candidatus Nanosynbacter sp. HMT-352 TaxID=2899133 RepID=UPI001E3ECEE2|nr:type IV secretion system protein [Candidatus Nanosynbacter sp. HMT-352]UHA57343.1 type IV secretion system protein [Candidatus Nanosynbacter sp. HMT-352]
MKVFMFIEKQVIKKVGRLKKPIIILCAFALFILPITNILLAHPALASKDPSRFSNLKENDQYKFFTYASAMAQCFNGGLQVHTDVDDQMLHDNVVFASWGNAYVYVGTYPEVKGFNKGGIKCNDTGFQQEAFNTFGISPNELLCYMGYPKNGLKGKNDSNTKHEECVALGLTNDFTYNGMPENGKENFLNALTTLTGYDRNVAEKNAYIKYRKYSDWIKGCVDGEATSKSDNTWKVSVINTDTKKVDTIYKPKGKTEYLYAGGSTVYANKPEFSCRSVESELAIAAKKYLNVLKASAVDTACAGLAGDKLKACKDGANHKGDSTYCETTYENTEDINACKQGQTAKIEAPAEGDGEEEKNSCGIDGIGWLVCPVMNFVAGINDAAYSAISGFLDIKPAILSDGNNSGAKQGWEFFRNIANAIFAVIFLWIIFSQISNVGVSNYGIKKILPRLIIGALLVNLSYYLCQIFVDLSNILGHTLKDALESGAGEIGANSEATGLGSEIIAKILGLTGAGLFIALAVGLPTLAAGFLAIMTVFIILVVRQAGIILLIAMSPMAFAAWLLPNTEDLFKKWIKMFRGLLLVFPIISLLYGAGKLAGAVLASNATVDPNNPDETMQLVALAATTMPLIATPFVLQNSLSSLGSIGAKIGKMSANAHSRFAGNVKGTAKRRVDNSVIGDTKRKYSDFMDRRRASSRTGKIATWRDNTPLGKFMGWDKGGARARATVAKAFESDVEDASTMLQGMTSSEIAAIAITGKTSDDKEVSRSMRAATIDHTMANGGFEQRMNVLSKLKGTDASIKQRAIKAAFAKGDNNILGNGFGDDILKDEINSMEDLSNMAVNNAESGSLQAEHLVQNGAATGWLSKAIADSKNERASAAFKKAGEVAVSNPNTAKNINQTISDALSAHGVVVENTSQNTSSSNSQQSPQNNQQSNSSSGGIIIATSQEDVRKALEDSRR